MKVNDTEKEYVLDLNNHPFDEHELKVTSLGGSDEFIPWGVEFVSNPDIDVRPSSNDRISIKLNSESLMTDEKIILKNLEKDKMVIHILHNTYVSKPKKYTFRISKKETNGSDTRIRIISKEEKAEIGWKCTYWGKPLNYTIKPMESKRSGYVDIHLNSHVFNNINTVIEFTQNKSDNVIKLVLNQGNDDVEIIKAD